MNLKSKKFARWDEQKFAYLIAPSEPIKNDQELYDAVKRNGRAVFRPFERGSLKLLNPESLSPEEFEAQWQGD
jgi:hypothetical protein